MRRWGVAMATATKVLTALREEGLVQAVPGVGMIVRRKRVARPKRRSPSHDDLTRARIVAAAVAVADADGLAGLSMRRIASEIGTATMSLYRHVADKDDLLLLMMDAAFGELALATRDRGWRERLELVARSLWSLYESHPWLPLALSMTRPQLVPRGLDATELVLSTLEAEGLDLADCLSAHLALMNYVRGAAVSLERDAQAEAETGLSDAAHLERQEPALRTLLSGGDYPTFARLDAAGLSFDRETFFEAGLQLFLDGVAQRLGRHGRE
jgi:AcrR family transcriptional regulator